VAAAYQHLGVLPKDKHPSYYWPSTLALNSLQLEDEAKLTKLIIIDAS
jgi:hypothetical protein